LNFEVETWKDELTGEIHIRLNTVLTIDPSGLITDVRPGAWLRFCSLLRTAEGSRRISDYLRALTDLAETMETDEDFHLPLPEVVTSTNVSEDRDTGL